MRFKGIVYDPDVKAIASQRGCDIAFSDRYSGQSFFVSIVGFYEQNLHPFLVCTSLLLSDTAADGDQPECLVYDRCRRVYGESDILQCELHRRQWLVSAVISKPRCFAFPPAVVEARDTSTTLSK